jgi:Fe2+ transport system protein FeoA
MEHEIDYATEMRLAAFTDALTQAERRNEAWLRELLDKLDSAQELPIPLCMMDSGTDGLIARITAQYELRRRLNAAGFVPGVKVSGVRRSDDQRGTRFAFTMNEMDITFGITEASAVWLYPARED